MRIESDPCDSRKEWGLTPDTTETTGTTQKKRKLNDHALYIVQWQVLMLSKTIISSIPI